MKKIILDTDIGGDCDDAGALTLLNRLCDQGEAELLGVTVDTPSVNAPYCAAAINAAFGRRVPIGQGNPTARFDDIYATAVRDKFPCEIEVHDGVKLLRQLVAQNDGVTIVGIGNLGLLRAFLHSAADEHSPLTGERLIEEQHVELVLMAGYFDRSTDIYIGGELMQGECNVIVDVEAARDLNANWTGTITYSPFELGYYIMTGKAFAARYPDHPMSLCYRKSVNGDNRCSWDPTAVLYAVRGECGCFKAVEGDVTVSQTGITDFTPRLGGKRRLLKAAAPNEKTAAYIDGLLLGE